VDNITGALPLGQGCSRHDRTKERLTQDEIERIVM